MAWCLSSASHTWRANAFHDEREVLGPKRTPTDCKSSRYPVAQPRKFQLLKSLLGLGRNLTRQRDDLPAEGGVDRVLEIGAWLDTGALSALDERVEDRGGFHAASGAKPKVVDAPDDGVTQSALARVVVKGHASVIDEEHEAVPDATHVLDGFA
jgi:hypothetical protein